MEVLENLRLLDQTALAQLLQLSAQTIRTWRSIKKGPPFRKIGRRAVYHQADVLEWIRTQPKHNAVSAAADNARSR